MTLRPWLLERFRVLGREHDLAAGGARRGRQAGRDHLALGFGIDGRVQELVERGGIDARHRLLLADQLLLRELDGDAQRRLGGALAGARLQHPQLALLDREFEVLHVAVVPLERGVDALELGEGLPAAPLSIDGLSEPASLRAASVISCGVRMPATTSSPCALMRNSP